MSSKPLAECVANRGIRLIQYGDSGVGKTVRASEATRWGRVEYHDFDDKISNLDEFLRKHFPERRDLISVVSYVGMPDEEKIKRFLSRIDELKKNSGDIATLVVDSYTRFEDLYLTYLMGKYTPPSGGFGAPRAAIDMDGRKFSLAGAKDSQLLAAAMKKLLGWLKDLNVNVIFNAHVKEYLENKSEILEQGTLAASGQIRAFLPTEFTEFHRLFVDNIGKNRVQARADRFYLASSALNDVPTNGIMIDSSLKAFDGRAITKSVTPKA